MVGLGAHSRRNDGDPVGGDRRAPRSARRRDRDWSPPGGGTSGGSVSARARRCRTAATVWTYGSLRCFGQGQGDIDHLVVNDVDQIGAFQPAIGPEPANREGPQPAVSEDAGISTARGSGDRSFPLERQRTWTGSRAVPADRAMGAAASRHRRQLSRPARIRTLNHAACHEFGAAPARAAALPECQSSSNTPPPEHFARTSIQPLESVRRWFIVKSSRRTKVWPDAPHRPLSVPHEFYPDH